MLATPDTVYVKGRHASRMSALFILYLYALLALDEELVIGVVVTKLNLIMSHNLFASPVTGYAVPDAEQLNTALVADSKSRQAAETGINVSNQNGWHSDRDLFMRPEESYKKLCSHIIGALIHVVQSTMPPFDIKNHDLQGQGWVNINGKGGFNSPHEHGGFHWSGCYYVSIPEHPTGRSGMLEFIDPRGSLGIEPQNSSRVFSPKFQVAPKSGLMIIFPSYLNHWVYPNQEDEDRISIAFNAKIVEREDINSTLSV